MGAPFTLSERGTRVLHGVTHPEPNTRADGEEKGYDRSTLTRVYPNQGTTHSTPPLSLFENILTNFQDFIKITLSLVISRLSNTGWI